MLSLEAPSRALQEARVPSDKGRSSRGIDRNRPTDNRHLVNCRIRSLNLPLSANEVTVPFHMDDSYEVLSDAGPNTWGMKLTASIYEATGEQLPRNPVEWLLYS